MTTKQQSKHWQQYENHEGVIEEEHHLNAGFPVGGYVANIGTPYTLILRSGERITAYLGYSTQDRTHHSAWETEDGKTIDVCVVAAWKEI